MTMISNDPIDHLKFHTNEIDKRLRSLEAMLPDLTNYKGLLKENIELHAVLKNHRDTSRRFNAIEKFMNYLLAYFDPQPKMEKIISESRKELAKKDAELIKLKETLRGALK